jgi:hypothetical protein
MRYKRAIVFVDKTVFVYHTALAEEGALCFVLVQLELKSKTAGRGKHIIKFRACVLCQCS